MGPTSFRNCMSISLLLNRNMRDILQQNCPAPALVHSVRNVGGRIDISPLVRRYQLWCVCVFMTCSTSYVTLVDPWNVGMCVCVYLCVYDLHTYVCMHAYMHLRMYNYVRYYSYMFHSKNQPSWGHKIQCIHRNTYTSVVNSSWEKLQTRYAKIFFFTLQLTKETQIWLCKGTRCKIQWEHMNWITNQKCTYGTKLQLRSP